MIKSQKYNYPINTAKNKNKFYISKHLFDYVNEHNTLLNVITHIPYIRCSKLQYLIS